ncbi:hypothetical protein [Sphaerisporangium perillae]|uniref:hypothetical protein n=1 Tax=Sphaerisporangium perillae TaxID=2935860 RepID=UPI00200C13FF|nr:hypothetical protein [Sphaerisporangium perillae]
MRKKYQRPGRRTDEENTLISVLRTNREQVDAAEVKRIRKLLDRDLYGRMILVGWDAKSCSAR